MKSIRVTMFVFVAVGLVMLLVGGALVMNTKRFIANAASAPGIVVDLQPKRDSDGDTLYAPVVEYRPPDSAVVTFTSLTSSRPAEFSVGEGVEVLYDRANPSDARIRSFGQLWLGPLILSILGFMFTGAGVWYVFWGRAEKRKRNYLMAYGTAIETRFQSVERNTSLEVNGRHPWCIVSQWTNPASGNVRIFKSENLWFDPSEFVKPGKIMVLLDPANEQRYHMDVSFLPKLERS
jgi:hypothetical protein